MTGWVAVVFPGVATRCACALPGPAAMASVDVLVWCACALPGPAAVMSADVVAGVVSAGVVAGCAAGLDARPCWLAEFGAHPCCSLMT